MLRFVSSHSAAMVGGGRPNILCFFRYDPGPKNHLHGPGYTISLFAFH